MSFLLSVALAQPAVADPPTYVLDSPDRKAHCSVWCWKGDTVRVQTEKNGHTYEWERVEREEVFLAVSGSGQLLVTAPGQLRVYEADAHTITTIPIQFKPEAAWYSSDGQRIYVLETGRVWQSNSLNWQPKPADWEQIWESPRAPLPALLWSASRQDRLPSTEQLGAWALSSDYSLRVIALGCLAGQGDVLAGQKLRSDLPSKYRENEGWLTAMAIAGSRGWEGPFSTWCQDRQAPGQEVFDRLGIPGRRWLARQLEGQASDELLVNLSQYQHPLGAAAIERLERLAREDNIGALVALRDGDYPQRDEVLTRLLKTYPEPPEQLRRYFRQHSVAESGPYWLELLRQHPKSADLPRILKSTYRVDLGSDPMVWEAWLKRRSANADERLQRLPDRDPARVLLRGWLGRLEPKDLAGQPRLVRLVAEPARLLDCQWLETLDGHHQLIPLGPGEPVLLGPERVAVDRTSGRQAWLGSGGLSLRELNGSALPTLEGKFSNESTFQFFGRGRWLVADQGVVDLSKRQTMRLPGSGAYLFLDGQSGPEYMARRNIPVWNLQEERVLPGLSTVLACDGRGYVVREKKHHVAYDLQGRSLGRLDSSSFEIHDVGPGARWSLVSRRQLRFEAKDSPVLLWTPGREPEPVPGIGGNRAVVALSPDGARMHAVDIEAGQEEIYEVPHFKRVACWPWRGSWSLFSSDHRYLSVFQKQDTWVYELGRTAPVVPPEGQRLLTELWTGTRLQAGLAVDLTPSEYQRRRQQWREQAGSDWGLNPVWIRGNEEWPWWWSLPGVLGLVVGWAFAIRAAKWGRRDKVV